jgi:hypothetical protein
MRIDELIAPELHEDGACVVMHGARRSGMSQLLHHALSQVLAMASAPQPFFEIEGMSGQSYRQVINQLIRWLGSVRYLEIGAWKGSTLVSALYGNTATAVVVDNWSEFGGPREEFDANLHRYLEPERVTILDQDWHDVDFASLGEFDIFLCDGPHDEEQQRETAMVGLPQVKSPGLFIVDDWNWDPVRSATSDALFKSQRSIEFAVEIRTTLDGSHTSLAGAASRWHNGYFFAVLT